MAPGYLPPPSTTVEELFLDSFDTPDVKIFLREYFHTHLIHILIGEFKDQNLLVKDPKQQKYLLWKNKILLYEAAENERALLMIELLYPHELTHKAYCRADEPSDGPILLIRRNHSGLVPNSRFGKVFKFIKEQLDKRASHTEYWLKTKHGNYIPYTSLPQQEKGTIDKKEKSAFVYHDQTFYPVHDFRMYLDGQVKIPTKIFIGHSRFDIQLVEEFRLHLLPYERTGELKIFYDRDLKMGDKWDEELKEQLRSSDLFVCMVSPHLLNTNYVLNLELPLAYQEGKKIVPLILEDCNWQSLEIEYDGAFLGSLGEYNAPDKGIPIPSDRAARQTQWKNIAHNLSNYAPVQNRQTGSTDPDGALS